MFFYLHIYIYNDKDVWTDFHWLQVHYFPLGWFTTEWNCWPDTTQAPSNRHILKQLLEQSPTLHPWYGSFEILVQDKEIHGNISMGKQPGKMAFENKPNKVTEKSQEADVGSGGYLKWLLTADQLPGWSLLGQLPQASELCWAVRTVWSVLEEQGLQLFVMGTAHKRAGHNVKDIKRRSFPKTQPLKLPKANIMPFHSPTVFLGIV